MKGPQRAHCKAWGGGGLKVLPKLVQEVRVIRLGWADRSGFQVKSVVLVKLAQH